MQDTVENGVVKRYLDIEVFSTLINRLRIKINELCQPMARACGMFAEARLLCLEEVDNDPMRLRRKQKTSKWKRKTACPKQAVF
jgi:hypothetical protein